MRILWLANMPTIYRVHFFNELGKYCDLDVIFERYNATGANNTWKSSLATNFNPIFLNAKEIGRENSVSLSILKYINNKYDLVIISSYSSPTEMLAMIKLMFLKIPYILTVDGGIIKKDRMLIKILKRFFIGNASYWLSTSKETDRYLQYYGAKKGFIYRYPFTTLFNKDIEKEFINQNEKNKLKDNLGFSNKKVVLAVGQFIHRKGFDILLKCCKNLDPDIAIVIIGGEITKEYRVIIDNMNLKNVHFPGFKFKEELKEFYRMSDVFVLPTREDIWGLVVNEAMAYGLPVITTNNCVSGIELIKDYENGFLIPIEDSRALERSIKIILNDDRLKEQMGKNNLSKIRDYTIENMARKHLIIFKKIMGDDNYE